MYSTLVDLLRMRTQENPEKKIYTFLGENDLEQDYFTYGKLDSVARAIAAELQKFHLEGERALLLYQPGLDFIAAFFGCLYAGVIAVPCYPPHPARMSRNLPKLLSIIQDAQPAIALTTSQIAKAIKPALSENEVLSEILWLSTNQINPKMAEEWQLPNIDINTLSFLQYTSGSTSTPKGVMVSHGNLLNNEALIQTAFRQTKKSIGVGWLPFYHDMGLIGNIIQPIYTGYPFIFISPLDFVQQPFRWLKAISNYRASVSGGPNFAYDYCCRKLSIEQISQLDLTCWEVAFNGAEPVRLEILEAFYQTFKSCGFRREVFFPCYGLAEATLFVTGGYINHICCVDRVKLRQGYVVEVDSQDKNHQYLVSSGQCTSQQQVIIVNPDTKLQLQDLQIGEIWVKGDSVAQGYWNKAEQNIQTFQAFTSDTNMGPFLRTGDLGFTKNGELFITGRLKDLIIVGGQNHYPQDIEWTVENSHPSIRPGFCAAIAIEHNGEEKLIVMAEIERRFERDSQKSETLKEILLLREEAADPIGDPKSPQPFSGHDVISKIQKLISENHDLPVYAILLLKAGSILKTSSGKIQRHACLEGFLNNKLEILWSEYF